MRTLFQGHQTADGGVPVYRVTPANKFRGNGCKYWIGTNYQWMLKVDKERYSGGLSPEPPMHSSIIKNEPLHFYVS